jgi:Fe-S-cluster containining protein
LNFTCTQCGNCCSGEPGYVWVTKEEIRRIAEFLSLQCRKWPFWNEVLRSPETWNQAHQKCPGINRGQRYDYAQVEAIRTRRKTEDASDHR